jgi:hypothetical protein
MKDRFQPGPDLGIKGKPLVRDVSQLKREARRACFSLHNIEGLFAKGARRDVCQLTHRWPSSVLTRTGERGLELAETLSRSTAR